MFKELYPFQIKSDGIYLYVKATAKSSQNTIGKTIISSEGNQLKIYVTAIPQDGKANMAIIELLSKKLNLAKSYISIIKGHSQQNKVFLIKNTDQQIILALRSITDF